VVTRKRWTESEVKYVRDNYHLFPCTVIAATISKTTKSVERMAERIGLKLNKDERHKRWSDNCRKRIHIWLSGENSPNWKGGISKDHYRYKLIQKKRFPEKFAARSILQSAVRRGKIKRLPCVVCGDRNSHGHHTDYGKPLEVVWLCRKHHRERHCS
jgi:hypothetical protein